MCFCLVFVLTSLVLLTFIASLFVQETIIDIQNKLKTYFDFNWEKNREKLELSSNLLKGQWGERVKLLNRTGRLI